MAGFAALWVSAAKAWPRLFPLGVSEAAQTHLRGGQQSRTDRGKDACQTRFIQSKLMTKTFSAKPAEVVHEWFVIDATDKVLGRVASEVALRLRGKHKAIYTPHVDTGDFIVVVNAAKLKVTGNKSLDKIYYRHSGFPGGIYGTNFRDMQAKHPGRALEKAVKGMLPKGPLGYAMIKKLKVYGGAEHPHSAQQPKVLAILEERT
jgi:large subunit ribosomal protein L13